MPRYALNYTRCLIIVHGKSEYHLTRYIYTNLHLPDKIFSRDNGSTSIQITALLDILSRKPFNKIRSLAEQYSIEYDKKTNTLKNFKLFIIMDTDDCDEKTKQDYISGRMFNSHPLKDYIVPIYNINNLEDIMVKAGIMVKKLPDSEKSSFYAKVFPINGERMSSNTIEEVKGFSEKIKCIRETNIDQFAEYCLDQALLR